MRRPMMLGYPLSLLLIAAILVLWVTQCSGPQPIVSDIHVQASQQSGGGSGGGSGGSYNVSALVSNTGPGGGYVTIVARLYDTKTGRYYQNNQEISLDPRHRQQVIIQVQAPPGTYTPEVRAIYPPGG